MSVITLKCQQNLHFAVYATCVAEKLCQECERRLKVFMGLVFWMSLCLQSQISFSSSVSNITDSEGAG